VWLLQNSLAVFVLHCFNSQQISQVLPYCVRALGLKKGKKVAEALAVFADMCMIVKRVMKNRDCMVLFSQQLNKYDMTFVMVKPISPVLTRCLLHLVGSLLLGKASHLLMLGIRDPK
jgi:hypothetical protein